MVSDDVHQAAERLLADLQARRMRLVTAESLTGGLIAATLTAVAGASDVVDRGFVTYSNAAKHEMLGVPADLIASVGAVSREVAISMAEGALVRSAATICIAVTGLAGPDGATSAKPVGLVHLAAARRDRVSLHRECRFGKIGRAAVRERTVAAAFDLVRSAMA